MLFPLYSIDPTLENINEQGDDRSENRKVQPKNVFLQVALNCAGVSRETDSLSSQILHNVFGLEQFLQVCEGMENLRAVLTLSTCFAHVNRADLEEKLYPVQQSLLVSRG